MPISDEIAVKLVADVEDLIQGLQRAEAQTKESLDNIGEGATGVGESFEALKGSINAALEVTGFLLMYEAVKEVVGAVMEFKEELEHTAEAATHLINQAAMFGSTVEEMQGLHIAAEEVGVGAGMADRAMMMLTMRMQSARDGSEAMQQKLKKAGIDIAELENPAITAEVALQMLADAHITLAEKADIFGRMGIRFIPLLKELADGHETAAQKAERLGAMTKEEAEQFEVFHRQMVDVNTEFANWKNRIEGEVLPATLEFVNYLKDLWTSALKPMVDGLIAAVMYMGQMVGAMFSGASAMDVFKAAGELLGFTLKVIASTLVVSVTAATFFGSILVGALREAIEVVAHLAAALVAFMSGDLSGAAIMAKHAFDDVGSSFTKTMENWNTQADKLAGTLKTIWEGKPPPKKDDIPSLPDVVVSVGPKNKVKRPKDKLGAEQAKEQEQEGLDEIANTQKVVDAQVKLGQFSAAQQLDIDKSLIEARKEVQDKYYEKLMQLDGDDKVARQKHADEKVHIDAVANEQMLAADMKYAVEVQKDQETDINNQAAAELRIVAAKKQANDIALADHRVNAQQHAAVAANLATEELAIEARKIAALETLRANDLPKFKQLEEQLKAAAAKTATEQVAIQKKSTEDISKYWQHAAQTMATSMGDAVAGMVKGTMTLKQALQRIFEDILNLFIEKMVTMPLTNYLAGIAAQVTGTELAGTAQTTSVASTAATTMSTKATEAGVVVGANAAEGASGAASAVASIPYAGPILAIAAFAAIMALIMGAMKNVKSAAGGMVVPGDQMIQAHKDEMVLPAHLSKGFQSMLAKGGIGGGGGMSVHIHAMDGKDVKRVLLNHPDALMKAMKVAAGRSNKGYIQ